MISVNQNKLEYARTIHTNRLAKIIFDKKRVLKLAASYLQKPTKKDKLDFKKDLDQLKDVSEDLKRNSINWFIKSGSRTDKNKLYSLKEYEKFFILKTRNHCYGPSEISEIKRTLKFFDKRFIYKLLHAKPMHLIDVKDEYEQALNNGILGRHKKVHRELINFLIDYGHFSDKTNNYYNGYDLANNLDVNSCLYCNRNYTITVNVNNNRVIRPELDHFFPQSKNDLLRLSFYNLIPSCHVCNANLKLATKFNLDDYFHPYLNSFDNLNVKFTYKPLNATAFFSSDGDLKVKFKTPFGGPLEKQINGNIEVFKLNEIYHHHEDLIHGLQQIQRLSDGAYLDGVKEILKDENGNPYSIDKNQIYEVAMINFYDSKNYNKRPMAKFTRDIAEELGLI